MVVLARYAGLGDGFPSDIRIDVAFDEYARHLRARRTPKSAASDIGRLRRFLQAAPVSTLGQITPRMVQDFLDGLVRDGRSPKTGNEYRVAIHGMFTFALNYLNFRSADPLGANPAARVGKFRIPAPEIVYLRLDQIEQQLALLVPHPKMRSAVAVMIYAGLRRGEVCWLRRDDVLLDEQRPRILVRAKSVDGTLWTPKTRKNRGVPVSSSLLAILRGYARRIPHGTEWFFPGPGGARWNEDTFSHELRRTQQRLGLPWRCNSFRHSFAAHLAQRGVSLYKISRLLGNSPQVAELHYAALSSESLASEVEFHRPVRVVREDGYVPRRILPLPRSGASRSGPV